MWLDATAYVPGALVESDSTSGTFFYCCATHTSSDGTNDPDTGDSGHDDFWYALTAFDADNCIVEVPTPYARADLADLNFAQSADVVTITHPSHPPHELVRTSHTAWTLLPKRFGPAVAGPLNIAIKSGGTGTGNTLRYKVTAVVKDTNIESVSGSGTAVATGNVTTPVAGSPLEVTLTGHGVATGDEVYCTAVATQSTSHANENAVIALKDLVCRATDTGTNTITLDDTDGLLTTPTIAPSFRDITMTVRLAFLKTTKDLPTTGSSSSHITLTWDPPSGERVQHYLVYRSVDDGPYGYIGKAETTDGAVPAKPVFTDDGIEADFESGPPVPNNPFRAGNYPRTSAYFQQRQWFAGTTDNPQKVWGSVTGDFNNFGAHTPLQDDDTVEFTCQENEVNEVFHLAVLGRLLILTRGAILSPRGDAGGAITPASINLETLSSEGCANVRPVLVGDALLFVERGNSVVREMRYDLANGGFAGYVGRDITSYARPLFDGEEVIDMVFASAPHRVVYLMMADGKVLGLTYQREEDIWAWHRHPATGTTARVRGITVVPEDDIDTVYWLVRRTVNGSTVRHIERHRPDKSHWDGYNQRTEAWYLDAALQYNGTNLLADGATVDATWTLTLTGGTTWAAGEAGLTLTGSGGSGTLFPGDSSNVGNGYRLTTGGVEYEMRVTGDASTTVQTVTLITASPASPAGTTSWVRMVDSVSGLSHLEAETAGVLADGSPLTLTSAVVASGALDLSAANGGRTGGYGIILAGLPYNSDMEMLPLDAVADNDAWIDRYKSLRAISVLLRDSRGFYAGGDSTTLEAWAPDPEYAASYSAPTPPPLITDIARMSVTTTWGRPGKVLIRQSDPLPLTIRSVVRDVDLGSRS